MTIFPFLISYSDIQTFIATLTQNTINDEYIIIIYILINFINIWFIIKIGELIIKTISKIINTIF